MIGFFDDVRIEITPAEDRDARWTIDAKHASYEIDANDVITIRVFHRTHVKEEPDDEAEATSRWDAGYQETKALPADNASGESARKRRIQEVYREESNVAPFAEEQHTVSHDGHYDASGTEEHKDTSPRAQENIAPRSVHERTISRTRCMVNGCAGWSHGETAIADPYGCAGPRCTTHYTLSTVCDVQGCAQSWTKRTTKPDRHGPAGNRCAYHCKASRLILCTVNGCTKWSQGRVESNDKFGPSGRRCIAHGAPVISSRCSVTGCTNWSQGVVKTDDHHGPSGKRCLRHGAPVPKCNVPRCNTASQGRVKENDRYGRAGKRCTRHGAPRSRCNVEGCTKWPQGRVPEPDQHGNPGKRCIAHGGRVRQGTTQRSASVPGTRALLAVRDDGCAPCNIQGCTRRSQGIVATDDRHGVPEERCDVHGAGLRNCETSRGVRDGCKAECAQTTSTEVLGGDV